MRGRRLLVHLPFLLAVCFCFAAGWFELTRARSGHTIAWVYTFEWPLFGALFAWMSWRVATDRTGRRPGPPGTRPRSRGTDIPEDDPGLRAWRAYLDEGAQTVTDTDRAPGSG
jgi:hypothetical protein